MTIRYRATHDVHRGFGRSQDNFTGQSAHSGFERQTQVTLIPALALGKEADTCSIVFRQGIDETVDHLGSVYLIAMFISSLYVV